MTRGIDVFNFLTPFNRYGLNFDHLNAQTQEDLMTPPIIGLSPIARLRP